MTSALPSNWQELIAGYALGDLSPEEAEELQHLLAENPDLMAEVASLQEVLALMPYGLPQQEPAVQLRDSILTAVGSSSAGGNSSTGSPTDSPTGNSFAHRKDSEPPNNRSIASLQAIGREESGLHRSRRRSAWYGMGGAIAALALVALGIDNYRLRQETQQAKSVIAALQQRGTQTIALEGTQEANAASGSLLIAESRQVFIVTKDLPVLPEGQVYRLWAMPSSGKNPAFCGQFSAKTNGSVTTQWVTPEVSCQSTTVQMLITSENASDPPLPKGSLVMQSRI